MPHPEVDNSTRYAFAPCFASDPDLRPLLVVLVQATVSFAAGRVGQLADEPEPIAVGGAPSVEAGEPAAEVSFRFEAQLAPSKTGTDVVMHGHAHPQRRAATQQIASLRVGPLSKSVCVIGDREWRRTLGLIHAGRPAPLDRVPLIWERAFGGWDRTHPDPTRHASEPRNPVGRGFRRRRSRFEEGLPLPNLEDPRRPLRRWGSVREPHGFGFVSPGWKPRVDLAGTYDGRWSKTRQPRLPRDFDPRFWNAAPRGLASQSPLRGDENVEITGVSKRGNLAFRLPGLAPPRCRVQMVRGADQAPGLRLDTIAIDVDRELLLLLWRGFAPVRDGLQDVAAIEIRGDRSEGEVRPLRRAG